MAGLLFPALLRSGCALLLFLAMLVCGCSKPAASPGSATPPTEEPSAGAPFSDSVSDDMTPSASTDLIRFTDDLGRDIEVTKPSRVAALIGSFADIWCLAGGTDTLVATAQDAWTSFDLELGEDVANLGLVKEPALEVLLASEPDFVLGSISTGADLELEPTLTEAGIPVAYFDVDGFDDYLRMLKICTDLTGEPQNYIIYGENVAAEVDKAIARADDSAPTVLCMRATGSSCKVKGSEGTVLGEMLADLGCINVADSDTSLLEDLSIEGIMAADPDYIFVAMQGSDPSGAETTLETALLSNPAWATLRAVQDDHFYTMEQSLYNLKPNARWGEAYEKLADILYPAAE